LERLTQSQEQTVWYSLWDKVWDQDNLVQAAYEVIWNKGSAGVDGQSTEQFERTLKEDLKKLENQLRGGTYQPLPAKRTWIEKPGSRDLRPLGIPAVRDRTVQAALKHVIEPILERDFARQSYGFRPGRSAQQALARVEEQLQKGKRWIVDADLKSYFDTIPHDRLVAKVQRRIADGPILELIRSYLNAGILEKGKGWQATKEGTPQGSVISPLLANLYLNDLDHQMEQSGREMVRYADDFVILCSTQAEAEQALEEVKRWVQEEGLTLHPTQTKIVSLSKGFDFLGFHFQQGKNDVLWKWPRKKSIAKLRATIRMKTRKHNANSIETIIRQLNPTLKGWHGYFRASLNTVLANIDGGIRRRLRSILRYRQKRRGISKGRENREIPNRWFEEHGLFSLAGYPS
jgi:RNA-directed DNA polymerase